MIFWTFIVMAVAYYFGAPILPLLVVAALVQGVAAFILSKNPVAIQLTIGAAIVGFGSFFVLPVIAGGMPHELPISQAWFEYITGAVAVIGLIGATIIGMLGGPGQVATAEER